ncbi:hypothetical protein B0G76_0100 [Paraburkholderia sp. BL23I1N1]|nr:hypothetical protein B0G76_0100 [Paraburkholderia sp. BL23I1N1]
MQNDCRAVRHGAHALPMPFQRIAKYAALKYAVSLCWRA